MKQLLRSSTILSSLAAALLLTGCGDTADALHNAADAATGNQAVREGSELRGQIDELRQAHEKRLNDALSK